MVILQVVIQKIPENLQEFETLAAKGRQPGQICALFLCALALFDKDKDAGTAAMNLLRGPRPIKLRQKASTGDWFLWEYSSILSGIRIPSAEDPWA